jgi:hypothetical protein
MTAVNLARSLPEFDTRETKSSAVLCDRPRIPIMSFSFQSILPFPCLSRDITGVSTTRGKGEAPEGSVPFLNGVGGVREG